MMLEDMRALVAFADAGSMVGVSERLHRTPSAVTRRVQRLEAELGADLLDRSARPPRLTPVGRTVLEHGRRLLACEMEVRACASRRSEPHGTLRLGMSHAVADEALAEPARRVSERFPRVSLRLASDLTSNLFAKLMDGDLDVAAAIVPVGQAAPAPLRTTHMATDELRIVAGGRMDVGPRAGWDDLSRRPWVLNPHGCLLRAALLLHFGPSGNAANVAAEIHNMHLQLAFVSEGYGLGLLPNRFLDRHSAPGSLRHVEPPGFRLGMSVAFVTAPQLGALESAATYLAECLRDLRR